MTRHLDRIAAILATKRAVAIADCVHPCGYRYGRGETNPYEQYIAGLATGLSRQVVRDQFVGYIRRYRPRHLGEALSVELSARYPLWYLPWRRPTQVMKSPGWCAHARSVIDVMAYFSEEGIPKQLVEQEFAWHENAFASIAAHGYQPKRYGYITVRELRGARSVYFVTDGNHRLSAISASGMRSIVVRVLAGSTIHRERFAQWPLVKARMVAPNDALAIFDAYFHENVLPALTNHPADIIDVGEA